MATNNVMNDIGGVKVVDKRFTGVASTAVLSATINAASASQAAMDTQLATLNGTYYTATMLQSMNYNDKIYALRVGYDAAGI